MSIRKKLAIILLGFFTLGLSVPSMAQTIKNMPEFKGPDPDRFPDDPPNHKIVFMFNKHDHAHQTAILNSMQALIKAYGGDVQIAAVAIGPAMHTLVKEPKRKVDQEIYDRIKSFAEDYNVRWIACGNTMKTVGWTKDDLRPFSEYVLVGAAGIMRLQEEGYSYIAW